MISHARISVLAAVGAVLLAHGSAAAQLATGESLEDGMHWRLQTRRGAVHVWTPPGYQPETAGVVVYVHGYGIDVDGAWEEHALAAQFRESGRNALFIVPAAPSGVHRSRKWRRLDRLIRVVTQSTGLARPAGALVVIGHSGAYRTLLSWLDDRQLSDVILLDALYGVEEEFAGWLRDDPEGRLLINIASETRGWSEDLARRVRAKAVFDEVPTRADDVLPHAGEASLLYMRTQIEHMEIITGGEVIPLTLELTALEPVAPESSLAGQFLPPPAEREAAAAIPGLPDV